MKALVTGGGGFLGRYVVEQLLARGDEVTVFCPGRLPRLEEAGARWSAATCRTRTPCAPRATAASTSSFTSPPRPASGARGTSSIRPTSSAQERDRRLPCAGLARLVYTSTPSVVFDNQPHEGCDESLPYPERFENNYLAHQGHRRAGCDRRQRQGRPAHRLSAPAPDLGPRDRHLVPAHRRARGTGKLPQVGDGTNMADLTYVEDAARAHLLAADALAAGIARRRVGLLYQPGRAGQRLGVDQRAARRRWTCPPCAGKLPLWRGPGGRLGPRGRLPHAAPARRAPYDPIPGQRAGHEPLL